MQATAIGIEDHELCRLNQLKRDVEQQIENRLRDLAVPQGGPAVDLLDLSVRVGSIDSALARRDIDEAQQLVTSLGKHISTLRADPASRAQGGVA